MAPRKKKSDAPAPEQLDIEQAIAAAGTPDPASLPFDPAALIKEFNATKAHVEAESKRFGEYMKPYNDRMEAIRQELHAKALEQKVNGFPTDEGTAYLSEIVSYKIDPEAQYLTADGRTSTGRDALLDWMLDNWDAYGSEGAMISVSKAVAEKWQEENGAPPPGTKTDKLVRINIRKS